jgi:pilus assembly protein Flp/PilA
MALFTLPVEFAVARARTVELVAQPLRFHQASRGREATRDRISHTHEIARQGTTRGRTEMDFITRVQKFVRDDEGQDLLEYALLVALIALVAYGAVQMAGGSVNTIFTNIATQLEAAI